jgi:hypothetical protein
LFVVAPAVDAKTNPATSAWLRANFVSFIACSMLIAVVVAVGIYMYMSKGDDMNMTNMGNM